MEPAAIKELLSYSIIFFLGTIFGIEVKMIVEYYLKLKRLREI